MELKAFFYKLLIVVIFLMALNLSLDHLAAMIYR